MTEKRRFKRFSIHQLIEISFGREVFIEAEGINISEGGMRCKLSQGLDPLSRLYLLLTIPLEEELHIIETEGIIRWCEQTENGEFQAGIEFHELSKTDKNVLKTYIESQ